MYRYVSEYGSFKTYIGVEYLDPTYMLCLYCVSALQFPFYIYCYVYTVRLVKYVYNLLIQILYEHKKEPPSTVLRSRCTGVSKIAER